MDDRHIDALRSLHLAAASYERASRALNETIGMGPALLFCLKAEERARGALLMAQQECMSLGILEKR